jgi:O-antigen/teichoic acid export membrane protein
MQNLAYVATSTVAAGCVWLLIKAAHPWLGEIFPLRINRVVWRELAIASGWVYLCSLGSFVYTTTDRLLINAGFGPELVPKYVLNNKLPDLAYTLIVTASFVSLPKITQWVASPDPADRIRVVAETQRLNLFQILLGCMAALGYLAINDAFIRVWLGPGYLAPAVWQLAFALNLAVSACGDAGIQLPGRFGMDGIRKMGIAVGGTGLLNLVLSFISMKLGYVAGIAFATVLAQSVLSLVLAWQTCRRLELSFVAWAMKSWLVPIAVVSASFALRSVLVPHSWLNIGVLLTAYAALLFLITLGLGVNSQLLVQEWRVLRGMVGR